MPSVIENPVNIDHQKPNSGNKVTLREPKAFADFVELIMGEINERMMDKERQLNDYQLAFICKALTAKYFIVDSSKPQVNYFLQIQFIMLREELGTKVNIEDLTPILNMLSRYNMHLPMELIKQIDSFI
jgi:hypothetical protein